APACAPAPAGGAGGPPRRPAPGLVPPLDVELEVLSPEEVEDGLRVTFWVNVRDARGDRCPDLAVEARIQGPERAGEGMAWTDRCGQAQFRMTGPPGSYLCEVLDVGGHALDLSHRESDTVVASAAVTA
ncbi:MAG: hypothetical protein ACRDUY_00835, partial [Nitriliruptorales bacterium]